MCQWNWNNTMLSYTEYPPTNLYKYSHLRNILSLPAYSIHARSLQTFGYQKTRHGHIKFNVKISVRTTNTSLCKQAKQTSSETSGGRSSVESNIWITVNCGTVIYLRDPFYCLSRPTSGIFSKDINHIGLRSYAVTLGVLRRFGQSQYHPQDQVFQDCNIALRYCRNVGARWQSVTSKMTGAFSNTAVITSWLAYPPFIPPTGSAKSHSTCTLQAMNTLILSIRAYVVWQPRRTFWHEYVL